MIFDATVPVTWSDILSSTLSLCSVVISVIALFRTFYRKKFYGSAWIVNTEGETLGVRIEATLYNISGTSILVKDAYVCERFLKLFYNRKHILWRDFIKNPFFIKNDDSYEMTMDLCLYYDSLIDGRKNRHSRFWVPYLCVIDSNGRKKYIKIDKNMVLLEKLDMAICKASLDLFEKTRVNKKADE